jgi:predicted secreted protein
MHHRLLPGVLACLLLSQPLAAQEKRGLDYNLVRLDAEAVAEVPNDQMQVILAVEHQSRDAAGLPALVNGDMGWALDIAKKNSKVRAQTGAYTTQPEYASTRIVGWRASQMLHLEGEDFGAMTQLVGTLQEKLQVKAMNFQPTTATRQKVESELTRAALKAFAAKAQLIAETMNARGYEVVDVTVNGQPSYGPRPMEMRGLSMAKTDAPVAVEAGTATITINVNGQIQLR